MTVEEISSVTAHEIGNTVSFLSFFSYDIFAEISNRKEDT